MGPSGAPSPSAVLPNPVCKRIATHGRDHFTRHSRSFISGLSAVAIQSAPTSCLVLSVPVNVRESQSTSTVSLETTLVVVAAHALVRAGLRGLLSDTPGLSVIGEASTPDAALAIAQRLRPDVVLFDDLDGVSATGVCSVIRRVLPATCVLCLAGQARPPQALCVPCTAGVVELCSMLGVALGDRCAGCRFRSQCPAPRVAVALSRRETQVAVCIADGMSSKQIAAALGIALRTVNTYRESLARKLGASSAAVVTRYVLEHQLAPMTPSIG